MQSLLELRERVAVLDRAIEEAWIGELREDDGRTEPAAVYASARRRCVRQMALELIAWKERPPFDPDALERMRRGKEREQDLIARLIQVGKRASPRFEVIHQQHSENLKDRQDRIIIRMRIDGRLLFETGEQPPFEIKRYDPNLAERIETVEDFQRSPYTQGAVDQMLMYLLAHGERFGFFILETRGLTRRIPIFLEEHLERAEGFLRDAETAMDAKEAYAWRGQDALPPYTTDPSDCRRCWAFGRVCNPPIDAGSGISVIDDPEFEATLARRHELEAAAKEYEALDKRAKERLKAGRVELALVGDFQVSGKLQERKGYEVKPTTIWKVEIERLAKTNGLAHKP